MLHRVEQRAHNVDWRALLARGVQRQVANPLSYSATPVEYRTAPPRVDEDRAEVLALLGLADA